MKSFLKSFLSLSLSLSLFLHPLSVSSRIFWRVTPRRRRTSLFLSPTSCRRDGKRTDAGCENSATDKETKMDAGILEAGFGVLTRWNIHWAKVRVSISSRLTSPSFPFDHSRESNRSLRTLGRRQPTTKSSSSKFLAVRTGRLLLLQLLSHRELKGV